MSRKMIDYQVEGNKISTIDGYKVGGDELTGDALMGITKDSTTITRTLDTDGKVKLDAKGGVKISSYGNAYSVLRIPARSWEANVPVSFEDAINYYEPGFGDGISGMYPSVYTNIYKSGGITFLVYTHSITERNANSYSAHVIVVPLSAGTTTEPFDVFAGFYYFKKA